MPIKRVLKKKIPVAAELPPETTLSLLEELQGAVPDDDVSHISEESSAAPADLYGQWAQWDAEHAKKRARLTVIVALTMVAIGGLWVFGVSETVSSFTSSNTENALSARERFVEKFATYQNELDKYAPASSTLATSSGPEEETAQGETGTFVESLKSHAADLLKQ